jgi:Domain of unknown function (DUF4160)
MPTVLPHFRGWRVVIFPNDHRPPHVHVIGAEAHERFELLCDLGQVRLLSNIGFDRSELKKIVDRLQDHLAHLCSEWGRIHGYQ